MVPGIIGLIIGLLSPRREPIRFSDQLRKYKTLFDSGIIMETDTLI